MNDTSVHDTSGGAGSAYTVRGRSGNAEGPSGSHYIIGPLQKASGPRKKKKTAMSHVWDTYHTYGTFRHFVAPVPAKHSHGVLCGTLPIPESLNSVSWHIYETRF